MKALKTIVSSLIVVLLIFSAKRIKAEVQTADNSYSTEKKYDMTLGHTLLNSKFLKNMYLYAPHKDPLKKLIRMLWDLESEELLPTQKGPLAAITPEIFEKLLEYVCSDIENEATLIDKLIDKHGWFEAYKKQIPRIIKQLEDKLKIIENELQKIYRKKRIANINHSRATYTRINNPTYRTCRWKIRQEEKHINKRLDQKRNEIENKRYFYNPMPEECQRLKSHLQAKIIRKFPIQSEYVNQIDEQGLSKKSKLIAIQKEEQFFANLKKETINEIEKHLHEKDEGIRRNITQSIKNLLQTIRQAITYEENSQIYFPRTTQSILWAFSESKFGAPNKHTSTLKNIHLTIDEATHYPLYNALDIEDEKCRVHVIKNAIKHKELIDNDCKQFVHTLANSVTEKKLIQKICKYILMFGLYDDMSFMNYIMRHPHSALLEIYNIDDPTKATKILNNLAHLKRFINKKDESGNTALHNVIAHQKTKLIKILLYAGANPDIKKDGKTVLMEFVITLMKKQKSLDDDNKKTIDLLVYRSDLTVKGQDFLNTEQISKKYKNEYQNNYSEDIHEFLVEKIMEKAQYQQELHMKIRQLEHEVKDHEASIDQHQKNKTALELEMKKIKKKQSHWDIFEKNNKKITASIAILKEKIIKAKQMIKRYPKRSARLLQQVIKSLRALEQYEARYNKTKEDIQNYKKLIVDTKNQMITVSDVIKNTIKKITASKETREDLIDELF